MRKWLLLAWLSLWPGAAAAEGEVVLPHYLSPYIGTQQPLSNATMRRLFIPVYDATLWTDAPSITYDVTYAMTLTYSVSLSSREFCDHILQEMAHHTRMPRKELEGYWPDLRRVTPDIRAGDTLAFLYRPKQPVMFFHNGRQTGEIADKDFARRFFGIWFSPDTSEPAFRQALLGMSD